MAYRFPPPPINKLNCGVVSPPSVPTMNFNIPPPGFRSPWLSDAHLSEPPPPYPWPPQEHSVLQPQEWGQVTSPYEDIRSHVTADLLWLKDWLHRRRIDTRLCQKKKKTVPLKVFEARCMLQLCLTNVEDLRSQQKELETQCHDLSPVCWREKWDHVREIQVQISNCLDTLCDSESVDALRINLLKRSKKRQRERRRRALHREAAKESRARRQHLHRHIDTWLKNMQEVVEEAKREESLKHEADQVLAEVTRKKSEAQRQINMLAALQKLRHIRAQIVTNRGQHVDAESGLRFARVTEHLAKLWQDQLKGYDVEEQGLRVMLDAAVVERTKSEVSQDKQILAEWETLLFGKRDACSSFYKAAEWDLDAFVALRHSWDQFVASPGVVMSSSIPVGWVLPCNPSSEEWESLLTSSNNKHLKM
ncbi:programmed cell death protein 7-like isoform X1 [Zootermopsis nevadensis]|uniref:programmed cell death protein 7-like isoform X1 n=1 Tax=Zootermopsis nevadensis TaxID=136037 RepID=UPI000B8EE43D|nr:programmed cell death protein 7-like isoform X1 [Zootermopsis nevadensis]XP_021913504.1 programmed cell death protein 7-like isoform X1 [Zootermopsis nevadensis]XP_021913591.1 programmed cell death protein 7-like isoform X1 [Zootermopsis nevadensis]XP_021913677.1 programmed cell death protein 7-like isoform X1 [Zootermopsis nevadensis]